MNTTTLSEARSATQPAKVLYTAKTHTTGGRDGGKLSVPGGPGSGTNPEQMFAAGWSACFIGAIKHVAQSKKVRLPADPVIEAEVDLCAGEDGYSLRARLNVSLPGLDRQVAQSLLDGAEQTCPYSKPTRGNIDATVNLV